MRPPSDTLSLTLPSRTKSWARRRQRKRPPPSFWWYLAWTVFTGGLAVWDFLDGSVYGVLMAGAAAWYWRAAVRAYDGRPPPAMLPWWGIYFAGFGVLLVTGAS